MGKLKELREKRSKVFGHIDELRKAADGREMSAEEQTKWDGLLSEYEKADGAVRQEERFEEIERRQAEQTYERGQATGSQGGGSGSDPNGKGNGAPGTTAKDQEYRSAFVEYLFKGENGVSAESRKRFEERAGITGVAVRRPSRNSERR